MSQSYFPPQGNPVRGITNASQISTSVIQYLEPPSYTVLIQSATNPLDSSAQPMVIDARGNVIVDTNGNITAYAVSIGLSAGSTSTAGFQEACTYIGIIGGGALFMAYSTSAYAMNANVNAVANLGIDIAAGVSMTWGSNQFLINGVSNVSVVSNSAGGFKPVSFPITVSDVVATNGNQYFESLAIATLTITNNRSNGLGNIRSFNCWFENNCIVCNGTSNDELPTLFDFLTCYFGLYNSSSVMLNVGATASLGQTRFIDSYINLVGNGSIIVQNNCALSSNTTTSIQFYATNIVISATAATYWYSTTVSSRVFNFVVDGVYLENSNNANSGITLFSNAGGSVSGTFIFKSISGNAGSATNNTLANVNYLNDNAFYLVFEDFTSQTWLPGTLSGISSLWGFNIAYHVTVRNVKGVPDTLALSSGSPYALSSIYGTILITTGAGAYTLDLPPAALFPGLRYTVIKVDSGAGAVAVTPYSGDTIEGGGAKSLASQYAKIIVVSDGAHTWYDLTTGGT